VSQMSEDQARLGQVENAINTFSRPTDLKITDMRIAVVASNYDYPIIRIDTKQVRAAGREPLAVQARMTSADRALFVGTLRVSPHSGPDPDAVVELSAPLGEIVLRGLRINDAPFSVRVSRLGLAMVEEAANGLQLGV